jgi:hypothetical protein
MDHISLLLGLFICLLSYCPSLITYFFGFSVALGLASNACLSASDFSSIRNLLNLIVLPFDEYVHPIK